MAVHLRRFRKAAGLKNAISKVGWTGLVIVLSAGFSSGGPAIPCKSVHVRPSIEPVDLRYGPQLLIDEYLVSESQGLKRTVHSPRRVKNWPILGWQENTTQPYITVIRDPETVLFRLWYNKYIGRDCCIAYAESEDGISWKTPSLGIVGDDNCLLRISTLQQNGYGVSVIDEGPAWPDPKTRYKMAWWGQAAPGAGAGVNVAFSADGLHWVPYAGNPVLPNFSDDERRAYAAGDIIDVFWDPIRERYAALFKTPAVPADGLEPGPKAGKYIRRLVSESVSEDFIHWEKPWRIIMPESRDEGILEFYSVGGTISRGNLLIGFVRMLRDDLPADRGGPVEGIGYTVLATSRDGVHWERHDGIFLDRNQEPGSWDHAMAWIGCAVPVGDNLYLYYGGYKSGHKINPTRERQIGLATMPMDRFVSRDAAAEQTGYLKTVPLYMRAGKGSFLTLNADASDGWIRLQIRDSNGRIVPGFAFDDCEPIRGNDLSLPVKWRVAGGKASYATGLVDLSRLDNQIIRIEFQLKNARLYGFDVSQGKQLPLRLGDGPHLFIDDVLIDVSENLVRKTEAPETLPYPAVSKEHRPEGRVAAGTLVYDNERDIFRMWHWAPGEDIRTQMIYCESPDPKHWEGEGEVVFRFNGYGTSVIDEGRDCPDPDRRYKLAYFVIEPPPLGMYVAFSADGKHWNPYPGNPVLPYYPQRHPRWHLGVGDIIDPFWDPIRRHYSAFVKMMSRDDEEFGMSSRTTAPGLGIRLTGQSVSSDFVHWESPWRIFVPDYQDEGVFEHYGAAVISRGDLLLAFVRILRDDLPATEGGKVEGIGYTVLATSRDGRHWTRYRDIFLDRHPDPARHDHAFAWVSGFASKNDVIYLPYTAYNTGHKTGDRQIGMAWLKRDRYVSRRAKSNTVGRLRTPLLEYKGSAPKGFWLNADAADGEITVRVLDEHGKSIPGFDTSEPIRTNGLDIPVKWKKDFSWLQGRAFKLEFIIKDSALYGFAFSPRP